MKITAKQKEKLIKTLIHNVQGMSFGTAQKNIRLGKIKVNGKKVKTNIEINPNDEIEVYEFKQSIPQVPVLYKDENILIVNKPYGIECATRDKSSNNTYSLEEIFSEDNAIVVHRLDRLTEGIVILARTKDIARKFEMYFKERRIQKYYKAGVVTTPKEIGIQKAYLRKNNKTALVEISNTSHDDYKEIITEIAIEKELNNYTILNILLHTGRTHQIRAHLAHLGSGIIGDSKYNRNQPHHQFKHSGYFLTAYKVIFNLDDDMSYLNDLRIEITPSWIQELD